MATNLLDLYAKISLDDSEFSKSVDNASAKFGALGKTFTGISNVGKTAFKAVGVAATAGGAALGAFVKASVNTGEEFDKSMSQVAATMGYSMEELNEKGSEANKTFEALRNAAIQYGETTAFTSTQASEALNYMALAGYDAETAISTLPAVLNLAAAGGLELGYASDMITDSQTALGLSLEETNVLMDQMAMTASKSNTSVGQLGEAILTVGGTAKYMSGGTKELSSVIGVLADNGIKGSEAGTHLRNMILKLSSPTDAGAAALNRLGVSIFDSEGKMRSFTEIFPELNAAMSNLTEEEKLKALSDIFNVRDIASANALLSTTSDRWEELGGYIEGAGGAMERMAETQLDNLAGDVTILNSALDGLKIAISDKVTPTLRRFAKQGTTYIGRVKKALTDRGWKGALTEVSNILSEMISAFVEYLPQVASVATDMIIAFIDGISANSNGMIQAGRSILESVLSGFAQIRERIKPLISQFIPTIVEYFLSFKGEMFGIGLDIISSIITGISKNIGSLAQSAIDITNTMANSLMTELPNLAMAGLHIVMTLANAILSNIPSILVTGAQMIQQIVNDISAYLPGLLFVGIQLLNQFTQGIIDNLPTLLDTAWQIINTIVNDLVTYAPMIVSAGIDLLSSLLSDIPSIITNISIVLPTLIERLVGLLMTNLPAIVQAGVDLFSSLVDNLPAILKALLDGVVRIVNTVVAGIKSNWTLHKQEIIDSVSKAWETIKSNAKRLWENIVQVISDKWDEIKDDVYTAVSNVALTLAGVWNTIKSVASSIWESVRSKISEVWESIKLTVSGAVTSVMNKLQQVWNSIKSTVSSIWESVSSTITNKWNDIKTTVSNAVTNVWDSVTNKFNSILRIAQNTWNSIRDSIMAPINYIKDWLEKKIQKIKDLFDFDWKFPKPKMPHFKVTGTLDLLTWPPQIPKVSIDWYKKAMNSPMLLDDATIFGAANGKLLGGGESGPEVVSGANTLMGMIKDAVRDTGTGIGQVIINIDGAQYEDADELANVIAEKLQGIVGRRAAAWA